MNYVLWDSNLNDVIRGPMEDLPPEIAVLSDPDQRSAGWYNCDVVHSIEPFNNIFHDVSSVTTSIVSNRVLIEYSVSWKPIDQLQELTISTVNSYRDEQTLLGFVYGGILFDSDDAARNNITGSITTVNSGLLIQSANPEVVVLPDHIAWTVYDNSTVMLTPIEMLDMGLRMSQWFSAIYGAARAHKDAILALTDPTAITTYDHVGSLWPSNDIGGVKSSLTEN